LIYKSYEEIERIINFRQRERAMIDHLGNILYWMACVFAGLWLVTVLYIAVTRYEHFKKNMPVFIGVALFFVIGYVFSIFPNMNDVLVTILCLIMLIAFLFVIRTVIRAKVK